MLFIKIIKKINVINLKNEVFGDLIIGKTKGTEPSNSNWFSNFSFRSLCLDC